jgi:hypothetical protein
MDTVSARSSPTIRSPRFSLLPHLPKSGLDLEERFLSFAMGEETDVPTMPMPAHDASTDSGFFDLHPPSSSAKDVKVEDLVKQMFSADHLHFILGDRVLFYKFSTFLNRFKPNLVPTLIRYMEMRKAMKAIEYANSVARKIRWPSQTDYTKFARVQAASADVRFEDYAEGELSLLCTDALQAFVTFTLVNTVVDLVAKDITDNSAPVMQDLVENLAEVFCLTDPSVHDNPIIYASEGSHNFILQGAFHFSLGDSLLRSSQNPDIKSYLEHPPLNKYLWHDPILTLRGKRVPSHRTIWYIVRHRQKLSIPPTSRNRQEHDFEVGSVTSPWRRVAGILAQLVSPPSLEEPILIGFSRRDGSPFVNLLMCAPLYDDKGIVRYFIGAQVDVTSLVEDGRGVESFRNFLHKDDQNQIEASQLPSEFNSQQKQSWLDEKSKETLERLQELSIMFSQDESDVVNRNSRGSYDYTETSSIRSGLQTSNKCRKKTKRIIGMEDSIDATLNLSQLVLRNGNGNHNLPGVYKHVSLPNLQAQTFLNNAEYILVRPYPSLQIIFVSPSLRLPGILRTQYQPWNLRLKIEHLSAPKFFGFQKTRRLENVVVDLQKSGHDGFVARLYLDLMIALEYGS